MADFKIRNFDPEHDLPALSGLMAEIELVDQEKAVEVYRGLGFRLKALNHNIGYRLRAND